MSNETDEIIKAKLDALPANLKKEVLNYIDFLLQKHTIQNKNQEKFSFDWEGGFNEMAIDIYHKYFTHDDVKGLIAFYQTDLGKKTINVQQNIVQESIKIGQKWGQSLEPLIQERISKRFKEEGFELE